MPAPKLAPQPEIETSRDAIERDSLGAVAHLAQLHREAEETARLANLLGRSLHLAIALPVLAGVTLVFGRIGIAQSATWAALVLAASLAVGIGYRRTIGRPFERAALKSFSQDMSAILTFAGFAWGAGAVLALPAATGISAVVLFAIGTSASVALLLRERESAFLFLAPATALASFACVLRPLDAGALGAAFVLLASGVIAGAMMLVERWKARESLPDLAGFPSA